MIGKPHLSWAGTMRAGDGNRTRMTSLEGFECGDADQHERRPATVLTCPLVTVDPLGSLSDRARSGHDPLPVSLSKSFGAEPS